ncbi:Integral membrane protein [Pyrenophora tritici-repentis]|nr:Integral membrane protein [Pyrenophora tritici-repentis]
MVVSAIVGVAYTSVVIFQCKPISYWWDLDTNHTGTCLSSTLVMNFTFVVSGLNSFADWVFAVLPVLIVKDLQMKKRMKFVVAGVIALAAIGCTATIARLPYTRTLKGYKGDFLYRTTDFAIWSTVEVGLGITAGSIATLRPLLKQAFEITRSASAMPWSKPSLSSGHMESEKSSATSSTQFRNQPPSQHRGREEKARDQTRKFS